VGQTIEVPFQGTGWVYLGEAASKRGISYISRRDDSEGRTFVFRVGEAGAYELKFYRQDFIRDYIINEVVTLIVEKESPAMPLADGTVPPVPPVTAAAPGTAEAASPPVLSPDASTEDFLRKAREEYDAGHIPQAIAALDQFKARFSLLSDEALWLYAQIYEAAGASRNIGSALDCYRRLVNEYPQSSRYADARRRIAYLERYYINIQ
jgi:hypothetical protein